MVRVRRPVVVLGVAGVTIGRCRREIPIDMATRTRNAEVRSGEREPGQGVIKCGAQPRVHTVALLAGRRETAAYVVRIRGALKILSVT